MNELENEHNAFGKSYVQNDFPGMVDHVEGNSKI